MGEVPQTGVFVTGTLRLRRAPLCSVSFLLVAPCDWELSHGQGRNWESRPLSRFCFALVLKGGVSENSRRLWLFLGSARAFPRKIPGKSREKCWKYFPNRKSLWILGFGAPGKANLPRTLGRHCRDLVLTFCAGCCLKSTVLAFSSSSEGFRFWHFSTKIARLSLLSGLERSGCGHWYVRGSEIGRNRASQT